MKSIFKQDSNSTSYSNSNSSAVSEEKSAIKCELMECFEKRVFGIRTKSKPSKLKPKCFKNCRRLEIGMNGCQSDRQPDSRGVCLLEVISRPLCIVSACFVRFEEKLKVNGHFEVSCLPASSSTGRGTFLHRSS